MSLKAYLSTYKQFNFALVEMRNTEFDIRQMLSAYLVSCKFKLFIT